MARVLASGANNSAMRRILTTEDKPARPLSRVVRVFSLSSAKEATARSIDG